MGHYGSFPWTILNAGLLFLPSKDSYRIVLIALRVCSLTIWGILFEFYLILCIKL